MKEDMLEQAKYYDEQAFACDMSNEFRKALDFYQKSLEIKEQVLGLEDEKVAIACRNIGVTYEKLVQYDMTEIFYERALQISNAVCSDGNEEKSKLYCYMGNLYRRMGEYAKSQEFLEKALAQSVEDLGEHTTTAQIYTFLASLYKTTKKYDRALEMEENALWIYEDVVGLDDERTQDCYQSIFRINLYLKKWEEANKIAEKLLDINIECFGENSREVFDCLNGIADSFYLANENKMALEIFNKILNLKDVDNEKLMEIYNSMGRIYQEMGDSQHTFEYYMKAYELTDGIYTDEAGIICNNIGIYFCDHTYYDEAILFNKKALKIREKLHGKNHPIVAISLNSLAFVYSKKRDFPTTLKLYHEILDIRLEKLGELHDDTIQSLKNLAYVYSEIKQHANSLEFYTKILNTHIKKYGENHYQTANSFLSVGITYYNLRNYSKAMECYDKSLELAKNLKNTALENDVLHFMSLITK